MGIILIAAIGAIAAVTAVVVAGFKSANIEASKANSARLSESTNMLSSEEEKLLRESKQMLLDERRLAGKIVSRDVRAAFMSSLDKADEILKVLKAQPEEIKNTKQLLNYYIPTLHTILENYLILEGNNVDITKDTEKVLSYLSDILKALDILYSNLFKDEKLMLSVEMEAMDMALQRDGLIKHSEYISREEAEKVELIV